jgi:hypothetical protein
VPPFFPVSALIPISQFLLFCQTDARAAAGVNIKPDHLV